MDETRDAHRIFVVKPLGKRPLGRPSRILENNIQMDLRKVVESWMELAEDRNQQRVLISAVLNLPELLHEYKFPHPSVEVAVIER